VNPRASGLLEKLLAKSLAEFPLAQRELPFFESGKMIYLSIFYSVGGLMQQRDLESREPKGFRTAGKIAGKVASGVSLGAT